MRKVITAVATVGILLAGCGTGTTQPNDYATSDAIIEDVRASGFDCEPDPYDAALDPGRVTSCVTEGGAIVARAFDTTEDYDTYRESMTGPVIFGDSWAVECTELTDCEHVQGVTGGEMIEPGHWSS